jgi:hypothetical protein
METQKYRNYSLPKLFVGQKYSILEKDLEKWIYKQWKIQSVVSNRVGKVVSATGVLPGTEETHELSVAKIVG